MRYALLVLLAGSCATSRHAASIVNDVAATAGIVHAAVQRYVPDPPMSPRLTPHEQAIVSAIPALVMTGVALWNLIEQWHAATPDSVDAGVP